MTLPSISTLTNGADDVRALTWAAPPYVLRKGVEHLGGIETRRLQGHAWLRSHKSPSWKVSGLTARPLTQGNRI